MIVVLKLFLILSKVISPFSAACRGFMWNIWKNGSSFELKEKFITRIPGKIVSLLRAPLSEKDENIAMLD